MNTATRLAHYEYAILCAKQEELAAVVGVMRNIKEFELKTGDRPFEVIFEAKTDRGTKRIILKTCGSMGHTSAAISTASIIADHSPVCIFFVGTAASVNPSKIQLGDVVIPRKTIYRMYEKISQKGQSDYETRVERGKTQEYFLGDSMLIGDAKTVELSRDMQAVLATVDLADTNLLSGTLGSIFVGGSETNLRLSKVHLDEDVITCGMVVDSLSYRDFLNDIALDVARKAAVIDMESYGFYFAIASAKMTPLGSSTDGVMIRGISDYAGRKQQTEVRPEDWKKVSVENAAIIVARIISSVYGI